MHSSLLTYAMGSSFGRPYIKVFRNGRLFGMLGSTTNPRPESADWLLTTMFDSTEITSWHRHGAEAIRTAEKMGKLEEVPF